MTWIRVGADLCQHPKTYALASLLKVRRAEAAGLLLGLCRSP